MTSLQLKMLDAGKRLKSRPVRGAMSTSGMPFNSVPAAGQVRVPVTGVPEEERRLVRAGDMLVSQMASGVAHDFNNRLQSVMDALDLLKLRMKQGRAAECDVLVESAQNALMGAAHLTRQLLNFARPGVPVRSGIDVNRTIESMETMLRCVVGGRVDLSMKLAAGPTMVCCDRHQFESALLNLIINAKDAMPRGGRIVVQTCLVEWRADTERLKRGRYVRICVSDTGTGMKENVAKRAFEPFFTTKQEGRGTGLGLPMIKAFAEQSRGDVHLQSAEGVGTEISIYLLAKTCEGV